MKGRSRCRGPRCGHSWRWPRSSPYKLFAGSAADNRGDPGAGKKGGKLTVLSAGDVDYMDPGRTYYTYAIGIINAVHRGLYAYPPDKNEPVPDLAAGDPEIAEDGKTVTVELKSGIKYTPPVSRDVKAADVKYAIERAFTAAVANGYAGVYFGDLVGAPKPGGDYKEIPGIEITRFCNVPDSETGVCPSVGWSQDFADPQTMLDPTFNGNNIIPSQNSNWSELDVPELNDKIEAAKLITDPVERAQAWSDVNHDIMAQAPTIPYMWDYQAVVVSPNVRAVQSGYSTTWDWNYTSLR